MSPSAHLLASWLSAFPFGLAHRERRIVTLAGVSADLDGVGWVVDRVAPWWGVETDWYATYHHLIAHNLLAALVIAGVASLLAKGRRAVVLGLSLFVVHLHFLCDVFGSRGPDGYQWPISYLLPFSDRYPWVWSGQWELNAWQNTVIVLTMLVIACFLAWRKRYSFVEVISSRLDRAFFAMLARYGLVR